MPTVRFGINRKKFNSTARASFAPAITANCVFKETTSVINPTLIVSDASVPQAEITLCNYFEMDNRMYWITDIRHFTNHICEVDGRTDVLATFAERILQSKAYITYTSAIQDGYYNPYLINDKIGRTSLTEVEMIGEGNIPFFSQTGCFALSALSEYPSSGATGVPAVFLLTASEMDAVQSRAAAPDLWEKVKDSLYNPLEGLIACRWIPIDISMISGSGGCAIAFGDNDFGTGKSIMQKTVVSTVDIFCQYKFQDENGKYDYRNFEPISEYSLWLPGFGLTEFPSAPFHNNESGGFTVQIQAVMGIPTGDVTYYISVGNRNNVIKTCSGSLGMDIPIGKTTSGFGSGITSAIASAGSIALAALSKNPAIFTSSAVSAASSAASASFSFMQTARSAQGSVGSWAIPAELINKVFVIRTSYGVSDIPENCREVIGAPLCKMFTLEKFIGFKVWLADYNLVEGGQPVCPCYDEWQELQSLLTSERGVFIEE